MRKVWPFLSLFAWALWLGGLLALFLFVVTLFHESHSLAVQTAPRLFHVFEIYQLILAGIALISTFALRRWGAGFLFLLATAGAIVSPTVITPHLTRLQEAGLSKSAEFARLHGDSMMIYSGDALVLVFAGIVLKGK
jgi:hypothetical protein